MDSAECSVTLNIMRQRLTPEEPVSDRTFRVDGWDILLKGCGRGLFRDPTCQIGLSAYGFVPDPSRYCHPQQTREYGVTGVWARLVHDIYCMSGKCTLEYDGEEHGLYRHSSRTTFGQELLRGFEQMKLHSRYWVKR